MMGYWKTFVILGSAMLSLSSLSAQRTWIVNDLGGPGVDHRTFLDAYDAASSGDTIVLEPGSGGVYQFPRRIQKALTILGAGPAAVPFGGGAAIGPLEVDEVFIVDNLEGRPVFGIAGGFYFEQCDGTVLVSRFAGRGAGGSGLGAMDCQRVLFVQCSTSSSPGPMVIERSDATLVDCEAISSWNGGLSGFFGPGSAIYVEESSVDIVGGYYRGGDEIIQSFPFAVLPAESAVFAQLGSIVRASEGAVFVGGDGTFSVDGYGIDAHASNPVFLDPTVTATTLRAGTTIRRELTSLTTGLARRGAFFPVRAIGPSNSLVTVFASLPSSTSPLDTSLGRIVVDPIHHVVAGAGMVDAQRQWATTVSVPTAVPEGLTLTWQAVSLSQVGAFRIGSPTATVVR